MGGDDGGLICGSYLTHLAGGLGPSPQALSPEHQHQRKGALWTILGQKEQDRMILFLSLTPQMPINASNALTLAHQLRVYTAEAASFSDMMDVVYVAQMIQKFLGYVDQIKEVRFN